MIFKTANFDQQIYPTGVENLDLPNGVLQHQWQSLKGLGNPLFRILREIKKYWETERNWASKENSDDWF